MRSQLKDRIFHDRIFHEYIRSKESNFYWSFNHKLCIIKFYIEDMFNFTSVITSYTFISRWDMELKDIDK